MGGTLALQQYQLARTEIESATGGCERIETVDSIVARGRAAAGATLSKGSLAAPLVLAGAALLVTSARRKSVA